ncbi:acyl-CoA dehydrogenase family protein [Acidovorax sp. MR-S7]|uniref:acyl-CoA dehydrogenase family protein n=1 Tax=Acidovorax sp. MR-S7 TaxID=1268622 RepID=UPI0003A37284|nr:acyl-CoA dehydrogenase family protein [Acidovorax sp. MR-S7]GAD21161.1 acyl-CoA dehydrogenases [Acidovorax sp. MR-S7]
MDLELSPEDQKFRQEVREFLSTHLTDTLRVGQLRTTAMYPDPDVSGPWQHLLNQRGWLVPLWPVEWGGTGWTAFQRFIFETECALAGAPLVHPMGVRLVGPVLLKFGTDAQKREHLPRILSGQDYWCQGFSEPNAGSDLAALQLRADRDGEDYVLNGSKIWTTHAHFANRMFALVRTSNAGRRQDGISFLLIDMSLPGVGVRPIHTIGGDHDVNEVHFDNVRVPVSQRVGEENAGWEYAKYLLEFERGAGIFSPRLRSQLKRVASVLPSTGSGDGLLHKAFGDLNADLDAFEWLEARSMASLAPGSSPGPVASVLKLRASRLKQAIGALGQRALGRSGLRWHSESPFSDATQPQNMSLVPEYCNSRAFTIFGGAAEIQLGLIAKSYA